MENGATADEQANEFCDALAAEALPLESRLLDELFRFCQSGEPGQVFELSQQIDEMYSARRPFASLTRWVEQVREPMVLRRVASLRQKYLEVQGGRELQRRLDARVEEYLRAGPGPEVRMFPYRHPTDCGDRGLGMLREPEREARMARFLEAHRSSGRKAELLAEVFSLRRRLAEERNSEGAIEFDPEQHIQAIETSVPASQLLARLCQETDTAYAQLVERRARQLGVPALEWWDLLAEPPELVEALAAGPAGHEERLALETLASAGQNPGALGISVHAARQQPGLRPQAFRFPVLVPGDVRVLVRHEPGLRGVELLLHELGHALYTSQIEQEVWEFRSPAGTAFTEAVGQLFARFCRQREWLTGIAGLEASAAARVQRLLAEQDLVRLRLGLLLSRFEEEAAGRGLAELDALWRELVISVLHIEPGDPELHIWASVLHHVLHPGQLQNLLLAELIAAHLWSHYSRHLGPLVGNEALGRRLARDVFRHGARYPWPQLLLKITGQELSPDALLRQIVEDMGA